MKLLVCGSRDWTDRGEISDALRDLSDKYERHLITLMHGDCRGADQIAAAVGELLGFKVEAYPANWRRYAKAAGHIRNKEMLDQMPDLVLAFHLNDSPGTRSVIQSAQFRGIPVHVVEPVDQVEAEIRGAGE